MKRRDDVIKTKKNRRREVTGGRRGGGTKEEEVEDDEEEKTGRGRGRQSIVSEGGEREKKIRYSKGRRKKDRKARNSMREK